MTILVFVAALLLLRNRRRLLQEMVDALKPSREVDEEYKELFR